MMLENNQLMMDSSQSFAIGDKLIKVTTNEIREFKQNNHIYIAKIFKPQKRQEFQRELNILRLLHHDHIIPLLKSIESQQENNNKFDMLIFKKATYGSLNQYIPLNGKFQQNIARVYFKQIISALKYAANIQPQGIFHPNILPSNILIDQKRQIQICGWSTENLIKIKQKLIENMLFSSCQILLLMVTGNPPFYNKQSGIDQYYRFVKAKEMGKFWQQLTKRIQQRNKYFSFSHQIKELVQKVFLGQWLTFESIQQSCWFKQETISLKQVNEILSKRQLECISKRQEKARSQLIRSQTKKSMFDQYLNSLKTQPSSRGSVIGSSDMECFLNDYYEHYFPANDVPQCLCQEMIELFDDRPNFVVATLKETFRKNLGNAMASILGEELKLARQKIQRKHNKVYFELLFDQIDTLTGENEDENYDDIQIKITIEINFYRKSANLLFAEIKVLHLNINDYFTNLIIWFIEENIKKMDEKDMPHLLQLQKIDINN